MITPPYQRYLYQYIEARLCHSIKIRLIIFNLTELFGQIMSKKNCFFTALQGKFRKNKIEFKLRIKSANLSSLYWMNEMTNRIALVTDSTCDIPPAWREEYEIAIVPLTIIFGDEQYLDGVDLSAEAFYDRLLAQQVYPGTSQPTPRAFLEAYQAAAANGAEQVLVITISGAMSGTIQSAKQAAETSPIPVAILDSKSNSMGLGWQVIAAARAREAGADLDGMVAAALKAQKRMAYYITLDTIEYLSKGGRIGGAAKFLNSVLKIRPMIYVNHESGTVGAALPSRTRKDAIEALYTQFFRHLRTDLPAHITVLHNAALEEAQALADRIRRDFSPREIFISIVSPVLGVHTGPRALALCGYNEI
jgi:DegV family protein with EDD domain